MTETKTRAFTGDERGGWYRFLAATCRTEHRGQDEFTACEAESFRAWDALTEDERETYRAQFRASKVRS